MARRLSFVCPSVRPSVNFFARIATTTPKITRSLPNLHRMVIRWARIQVVLKVKVKVKGHVIRTLLCWHEKCFSSQANGQIATKLATMVSRSARIQDVRAQFQGQGQRSRDTGIFVLDLKSLFLAGKWLDCDQTCTRWSSGEHASSACSSSRSRSKVTCYGHFCPRPKIAFSRRQMARLRPNLQSCTRWSAGQPASRVCSR